MASEANSPEPPPITKQATALPYRFHRGRLEFCLITSAQKQHWTFPKGMIDPGESSAQTALKEAREEAGLGGAIVSRPLGQYRYSKWGLDLVVTVRLMHVTQVQDQWDEAAHRQRRWATADEARQLIARPELRQMLERALQRIGTRDAA